MPSPPAVPPPFAITYSTKRSDASISLGSHPGQSTGVRGTHLLQADSGDLRVFGFLTGLTPKCVGKYRIYDGHSCASPHNVGSFYVLNAVPHSANASGITSLTLVRLQLHLERRVSRHGMPAPSLSRQRTASGRAPLRCE